MPPRYIVRRIQDELLYTVWDSERNRVAVFEGRECVDLRFDEALNLADHLNAQAAAQAKGA
jgi:hypothetical protein